MHENIWQWEPCQRLLEATFSLPTKIRALNVIRCDHLLVVSDCETKSEPKWWNRCTWVVPKNGDTPKWMVKIMENPKIKWMIWGETHHFRKPPYAHIFSLFYNFRILSVSDHWTFFRFFFSRSFATKELFFLVGIRHFDGLAFCQTRNGTGWEKPQRQFWKGGGGGRKGDNLVTVLW